MHHSELLETNYNNFKIKRKIKMEKEKYLKPEMENYRMESESKLLAGSVDPLFPEGAKKNDFFTEGTEEEKEN
jgi:hypothetical protein